MGECEVKARKGLIRAKVVVVNGRISDVSITGDFLMSPEDVIYEVEDSLKGAEADKDAVRSILTRVMAGAELIGATVDDFVDAIVCAMSGEAG